MHGVKDLCKRLLLLAGMSAVIFMVFIFARSSTAIAVTHSYEYITTDTTWHAADNPHVIEGYVIVDASSSGVATLTLQEGCILQFKTNAYLQIGNVWYDDGSGTKGALIANGTPEKPITFDARYASWYAIRFLYDTDDATTIMDYCIVREARYGISCYHASPTFQYCTISGGYYGIQCSSDSSPSIQHCTINNISDYGIHIDSGSPTIQHCSISNVDYHGIYVGGGSPNISDNTISNCGEYGILSWTTLSATIISNNICNDNGLYPIALHPMAVISTGNSGSGNGMDAILINSDIVVSDTTWVDQETGFDYVIDGYVSVQAYASGDVATLTIAPGFTVKFGSGAGIQTANNWYYAYGEGALHAQGTNDNPITFTSKAGSPVPGNWNGIYFGDLTHDAGTIMDHCTVEFAYLGIQCNSASPTIQNCTIRKSSYSGIYISGEGSIPSISCSDIIDNNSYGVLIGGGSNPSVYHCNITGNASYGVYSDNASVTVDAKSNWWNAADGPGGSGSGSGDAVSDYVDYGSWKGAYYICINESTAIELVSFTANGSDDGGVTLQWKTATEVENAGFNIYRSKRKDGDYTKINDALIASKGDGANGASYTFEDTPGRGSFYYQLEDVDKHGASAMHGPEKVRVRSGGKMASRR